MLTLREKHEYEDEIAQLKVRLRRAISVTSYYKVRCESLSNSNPKPTDKRLAKAIVLIKAKLKGDESLSYRQIAKKCFLAKGTIYNAASRVRKQAKLEITI